MTSQSIRKWGKSILLAALVALLAIGFSYTWPADLALLAAIDMATYADALIGVFVLAQVARLKPMLALLRASVAGVTQRCRGRRSRTARKALPKRAANDDHPAWAMAA